MAADCGLGLNICTFTATLYEKILKAQHDKQLNTLICPLSVYTALAMTLAGSNTETEAELCKALHLNTPVKHDELGSGLKRYFETSKEVELKSANRMFVIRLAKIHESFKAELQKHYQSECESLAHLSNDDERRKHINQWVAKMTEERIQGLLPSGSIDQHTIIMLVNALFFKGSWANQFPVAATKTGQFRKHDGSTFDIPFMSGSFNVPYEELEDVSAQAVKLPFQGNSSQEMLIVLPFGNDGLPEIQQYLQNPDNFQKLLSLDYVEKKVKVMLPKFKLAKCPVVDIKQMLKEMGVRKLFDPSGCDLRKISDDLQLFVSGIYHQAVLEVDEKGATAAAATAVGIANRCLMREPIFKVDRPFFVAILRDKTIPVFVGHVWEPELF